MCFGGYSVGETPGDIPNPVAKPVSADGTARGTSWESRTPPDFFYKIGAPAHAGAPIFIPKIRCGCALVAETLPGLHGLR